MPKLLFVFESERSEDRHNLLNGAQSSQDLPEGVEQATGQSWIVEFPKNALFLATLTLTAEKMRRPWRVFEIVSPSDWQHQSQTPNRRGS